MVWWRRKTWRRRGDLARDRGDWTAAAAAYRRHLAAAPGDAAIWVQLGHADKALGDFAGAEEDYRRAVALAPEDADPPLMLGHLLKLAGRPDEAFDAYLASHRLAPGAVATDELTALKGRIAGPVATLGAGATLFSIQDLFLYLHHHPTMSGIQRVQAGIALYALDDPGLDAHFVVAGQPPGERGEAFLAIDPEALRAIVAYASGAVVDHRRLKTMLVDAELVARRVRAGAGSTVMLLGAFWALNNSVDQYLMARRAGARIGAYVYDVIPITHPHFCDPRLVRDFAMALADLWQIVDFVFTISDATRHALAREMAARGQRAVPMTTVPLAHVLTAPGSGRRWPAALAGIEGRPYVAYVSTIEGRKNHIWLVRAWQRLIADGVAVPDLVFVGRPGWRVKPLMALIDETDRLGGRVHLIHGLSDAELGAVYEGALFTAFTSLVEGWGLPVGESLAHGVPCVATNVSSIPEAGGDFADYVDPDDFAGGVEVLRRMIEDAAWREERRRRIAEAFRPRDWHDVGRDFVAALKRVGSAGVLATQVPLPAGVPFRPGTVAPGEPTDLAAYWQCPGRMMLVDSFYPAEADGAWLRGMAGALRFQTILPAAAAAMVYVGLYLPRPGGRRVGVAVGDGAVRWIDVQGYVKARLSGVVGEGGVLTVTFRVDGDAPEPDLGGRTIAVGLDFLAHAAPDDLAARQAIVEAISFPAPPADPPEPG